MDNGGGGGGGLAVGLITTTLVLVGWAGKACIGWVARRALYITGLEAGGEGGIWSQGFEIP